eukprot:CAMPEP_0176477838 /NCGR_PEP_ID=MMETSP0200_2-20121128/855_1 /TAXON_ID=947934 /ORGANISM="Chaetoceros sp., Strain GSL56" /LENGTH=64 /DNA_ID=CAMNT_0017873713 /DNA_START=1 /DNA_END=195 /DNA_ORIENTATION=-
MHSVSHWDQPLDVGWALLTADLMALETVDYWTLHWESRWASCLVVLMVALMASNLVVHSALCWD